MSAIVSISDISVPLSSEARPLPVEGRPLETPMARKVNEVSFGDVLGGLVARAAAQGHESAHMAEGLARGTNNDIHGTMIAGQKADFTLKLTGTVRDKLLEAFHEIWRTSV